MFESDFTSFENENDVNFNSNNLSLGDSASVYPQLVYRSIAVPTLARNDNNFLAFQDSYRTAGPIDQNFDNLFLKTKNDQSSYGITHTERNKNECPDKPVLLMRTHFEIEEEPSSPKSPQTSSFSKIVSRLSACLLQFSEYDFSPFSPTDYMWQGKYIRGSSCCEIQVFIYQDRQTSRFIVETHRIKGDSKPFLSFHRDFKSLVTSAKKDKPLSQLQFTPLDPPSVSDELFLEGLRPIFVMADAPNIEARLESAKMLCDLFVLSKSQLQLEQCKRSCVSSLERLLQDPFDDVKQHAIMALANLADIPGYEIELIRSHSILSIVVGLIDEDDSVSQSNQFETIQMRRECARILSSLTRHFATAVSTKVTLEEVKAKMPFIKDVRLLGHLKLAIENLQKSF